MAAGKEIRNKIKSVENTKKITKAMEMVAASKMRKAQERMRATRPYSEKIKDVVGHLSQANPDYSHPFLIKNEKAKKSGIIVVSTDKGLCGGLNTNVFRKTLNKIREIESEGNEVEALAIGIVPMVWRNYDINNTYVIDEWQRVQTFEEFQTKALMLRDDKFHEERLELARQNYAKVHLTEEEYYKEFEKRMNDAI